MKKDNMCNYGCTRCSFTTYDEKEMENMEKIKEEFVDYCLDNIEKYFDREYETLTSEERRKRVRETVKIIIELTLNARKEDII